MMFVADLIFPHQEQIDGRILHTIFQKIVCFNFREWLHFTIVPENQLVAI